MYFQKAVEPLYLGIGSPVGIGFSEDKSEKSWISIRSYSKLIVFLNVKRYGAEASC